MTGTAVTDTKQGHPTGLEIQAPTEPFARALTPEALQFVATLAREFEPRRQELLRRRVAAQERIDAGEMPHFLEETEHIRRDSWTVAAIPNDLQDRRVEITGPTDRKMVINALNSGARVFMADFEDANSPSWENMVQGQINLHDAVLGTITYESPEGKKYSLKESAAILMARPRGWHLSEKHVLLDGQPISGSIFDFGMFFFHNAKDLLERGSGPYFYLPKLEHHLEARLWNDVFIRAQELLGVPPGTIRATVLIETITAAFQMDEILWELREHSAGLNAGRWDYIFSVIKKFRARPEWVLPDRSQVTMTAHMMHSYSLLLIKTCHRRGIHGMGGMAAYIPVRADRSANEEAISRVVSDKRREAGDGHDGTWVAHPGLVPVALDVFNELMPAPNQIDRQRDDINVSSEDLLTVPEGAITEAGLRQNLNVGLQYIESWLQGQGAAAIANLMEDAATAEISRAQVWQWIHREARFDDGRVITPELVRSCIAEELETIASSIGTDRFKSGQFDRAAAIFEEVAIADGWHDFLTTVAYEYLP